jgi:hypothetical protein
VSQYQLMTRKLLLTTSLCTLPLLNMGCGPGLPPPLPPIDSHYAGAWIGRIGGSLLEPQEKNVIQQEGIIHLQLNPNLSFQAIIQADFYDGGMYLPDGTINPDRKFLYSKEIVLSGTLQAQAKNFTGTIKIGEETFPVHGSMQASHASREAISAEFTYINQEKQQL